MVNLAETMVAPRWASRTYLDSMVFFRRHPAFCSIAAGLMWILLVGFLDVQTSIQFKLGPFYLLPVLLVAWHGGLWHGVFAALVAASAWRGIEVIWSSSPRPGSILFWDAFLHLVSFVAVSLFISWANSLVKRERALVHDLSALLADVKELQGLLPMCAWCKKVRDDQGYWQQLETYIKTHSKADWTHGICPECVKHMMKEEDDFLPDESTQTQRP